MKRIMFASLLLITVTAPALAASEADFKAAYAAAEAAENEAGSLRNQWITTETSLSAAKKAAEKGDFDAAIASAKEAEALARASIFQATSEKDRWKDAEVH
jgi:predicted S18 family serine protease